MRGMLDEEFEELPTIKGDSNSYYFGKIGKHKAVIAYFPYGDQGVGAAANVATHMQRSFPNIELRLLVGIGGGIPNKTREIRLGDVVIGMPDKTYGGVVQYDLGKATIHGFERKGFLAAPPEIWRYAVVKMQSDHRMTKQNRIPAFLTAMLKKFTGLQEYTFPGPEKDLLFPLDVDHVKGEQDCSKCATEAASKPKVSRADGPQTHYGTIVSGDSVMKNPRTRDMIAKDAGDALCFEMEAAGMMNNFKCIVIRGVADYADSHKNDVWHPYAAATAAACAKELLTYIAPPVSKISLA